MAQWRLDGRPRTARRCTTDQNCPPPTPEDQLLFILVYLKTYPLQVVQGRLFGMGQSNAHQWIHVLPVVLRPTLPTLGDAPTRSVTELAMRLGVAEAEATALVVLTSEPPSAVEPPALARLPPCGHDGTERHLARPQDPVEQTRCDRGKKKCPTVKHVRLIDAALTMLFLRATAAGSTHDKWIAEATPYPLPAGIRLLQELGFLAFTLTQPETIMPTHKPRGRALTRPQKGANRRIACRRARIEHVNSSVKRCRIVHDTCRLRKAGVRDLLMVVCCGRHNFSIRLTPRQSMVKAG
jgi:DDE superfamily endonuclease/Helix-turn-helix of DDE superfamily endonuclease